MRIVVRRNHNLQIYFVVRSWRPRYKRFNEQFCKRWQPLEMAIWEEARFRKEASFFLGDGLLYDSGARS